jgi:predicted metal-binding protein
MNTDLKKLIQFAHKSGASEATIVSTKDIIVDNNLADKCREPRCENYGMSKSCPPHVSGPSGFRKQLEKFSQGIFFNIHVPSEILYSNEGFEFFHLLHEIASGIEHSAIKMGFANAQAYAGGPCKKIFCNDHAECLAISEKGICRNPQYARPSMSGFGINVAKLVETAGWNADGIKHEADSTTSKMANIYGLILIH